MYVNINIYDLYVCAYMYIYKYILYVYIYTYVIQALKSARLI